MSRIKAIARNLLSLFTQDYQHRWLTQDLRMDATEQRMDERLTAYQEAFTAYQAVVDERLDERLAIIERRLDERLDERLARVETELDKQFAKNAKTLDNRFDKRVRALDLRVDDRLAQIERHIDDRFNTLERRTDARLETHERTVDGKLHQRSEDIVDRTDIMLQMFDQRLDQMRRELHALREVIAKYQALVAATPPHHQSDATAHTTNGHTSSDTKPQTSPGFRKLAEAQAHLPITAPAAEPVLYHQILAWKKIAHEGLNDFTPDEQEMVDYILSFLTDEKEIEYVKQHLRRYISTLQRIPPAQKTSDRLLELGCRQLALTSAIRKFSGYSEVYGADLLPSEEKVLRQTVRQKKGSETHTFEVHNFDAEREPFPYSDHYFRAVICCEIIEHLQYDPMHMLWECNRVLEPGGFILLTTPNITCCRALEGVLCYCPPYLLSQYNRRDAAEQHNREYAPYEVGAALAAAGFTMVEMETEDVWARSNPAIIEWLTKAKLPTALRGDNIFALARKTSAPVERYPQELYIE